MTPRKPVRPDLYVEFKMDGFDASLNSRIAELENEISVQSAPPRSRRARSRLFGRSAALAPLLALTLVTSAAGSVAVLSGLVRGYPGVQDPGQPLAGIHLECMTPPDAAAFLSEQGFTDVIWQVESGDPGRGESSTVQASVAPADGYVIPGSILGDGRLHMIVDQRVGATGVGDCPEGPAQ